MAAKIGHLLDNLHLRAYVLLQDQWVRLFVIFCGYQVLATLVWRGQMSNVPSLILLHHDPYTLIREGFLHTSMLSPVIGHMLGIEGKLPIYIFYGCFFAVTLLALFALVRSLTKNVRTAGILLALLSLSPLLHILYTYVGRSDAFVVLTYIIFVTAQSALLENGAAFLLILAHREQALIIFALQLFLFPSEWRKIARSIPGIAGGLIWYVGYNAIIGPNAEDRLYWAKLYYDRISFSSFSLYLLVASLLAFGFFLVPIVHMWLRKEPGRWRLAASVIAIMLFTGLVTNDHTRVAMLLSLPVYLFVLRVYAKDPPNLSMREIVLIALLGLLQWESLGHEFEMSGWHQWFPDIH